MYYVHSKANWLIRSSIAIFCIGLVMFAGISVNAQEVSNAIPAFADRTPGFIDREFSPVLAGAQGTANRTLVQPDGKILVAGNFQLANGVNKNGIARYNVDGTLDTTFNEKSGANNAINAMALQSNGKIIIGGAFTLYGGQPVGNIARLNTDGSLDVTFNSGGMYSAAGAGSAINDIAVASNDSIYIGGGFTTYNGVTANRLARLNANGGLDTTFAVGTGPSSTVNGIKIMSDGKILIGGSFTTYNGAGNPAPRLAKVNTDGTLDSAFSTAIGTGPSSGPRYIEVLPDNKIMIGGTFVTYNGAAKVGLARLNSDGTLDNTFEAAVTGTGTINVSWATRQADGKLVLVGTFTGVGGVSRVGIARVSADGALDTSFDPGAGLNTPSAANSVALQSDGKVVLAGTFTSYNGTARSAFARANADGSLDTGMITSLNVSSSIFAIARQDNGKLFVGGNFLTANAMPRANLVKLNADGSNDNTFNTGTGPNAAVSAIGIQPDGKIIISGNFTSYNGTTISRLARINTDGSLDASFNVGQGLPDGCTSIVVQPDGKILIAGGWTTYNGSTATKFFARLNSDGSVDPGFNIGTSAQNTVFKIALQSDGKILIVGDFSAFNGVNKGRIIRLNADGTNDATFDNGGVGFTGRLTDVAVQGDGKVVVSGSFTTFNGSALARVARLNSNGTRDTSFDPAGAFASGEVSSIVPTPDGKYMVVGTFTTVAGLPKNRIARVRSNGTLDPKFLTGLGPAGSGATLSLIVPHNGRYIIGGTFSTFNTSSRTSLVSISNATKAAVDFDGDGRSDWAIAREYDGIGPWTYWVNYNDAEASDKFVSFDFGVFTLDSLQPGDYDGDGITDVGMFRGVATSGQGTAYWVVLSTTNSVKTVDFGLPGDRAVGTEDYDGDGKDDMATFRAPSAVGSQATWFYRGSFNNPNGNITYVPFGMRYGDQADQVDKPIIGDVDGDGKADFRVQRRADITIGTLNQPGIIYTLTATGNLSYDYFGQAGDRTLPGDYDGDGKTDIALARGFNISPGVTTWYIRYTGGAPDTQFQWGAGNLDQGAQGDYDGDGITDPTVYRRGGENSYYVLRSSDKAMQVFHWGTVGPNNCYSCDIPVATYNSR